MKVQLRQLRIRVTTDDPSPFGVDLPLRKGLNILRADNSAGKSTCVSAIVWALGLEGMLGPEHAIPLPHAVTSYIEDLDGRERAVLESYVMVELRRADGEELTIRRYVRSDTIDTSLVRVWSRGLLSGSALAVQPTDYYVRRPGAAQEARGFHRFLAEWLQWSLPEVPKHDGGVVPLYLEAIAPLFIVEQKRGWSGIQAQTPTYLGIREVKQRALEYVLNLDLLSRRARVQELERALTELRAQWRESVAQFQGEVQALGGLIDNLPADPVLDWPPTPPPQIRFLRKKEWTPLEEAVRIDAELVSRRFPERRRPARSDDMVSEELSLREGELQELMAAASQLRQELAVHAQTLEDTEARLGTINEDRRRHQDLMVLRRLGSDDSALFHTENCPVCHRSLGDVLLDEEDRTHVLSVEETLNHLDGQRQLLETARRTTGNAIGEKTARFNAFRLQTDEVRSRIAALRETLVAPGTEPSVEEVEERLTARQRLSGYEKLEIDLQTLMTGLQEDSVRWREAQAELKELRIGELSDADRATLEHLERLFVQQLEEYGFSSFRPEDMYLSLDTYRPTHDGYDPAFESSASDLIRIIWAYLVGLLQTSQSFNLNHPGLLLFDEPRQQMTAELSFRELLRRTASLGESQILFATSESETDLNEMLADLAHNTISFEGKILRPVEG